MDTIAAAAPFATAAGDDRQNDQAKNENDLSRKSSYEVSGQGHILSPHEKPADGKEK
jgi:hypothetical protein